MHDTGSHVAKPQYRPVVDTGERDGRFGAMKQHVLGFRGFSQFTTRGQVIGVKMRIDDVKDSHAGSVGGRAIEFDVADRIDDGRGRLASATKEIGNRDRHGVEELTHDHGGLPAIPGDRLHSIN